MSEPVITLRGVSFAYGPAPTLRDLTLRILPGEYVGVIGPNGGGKTTLMKLLTGLLRPQTGEISLFGVPLQDFREWHKIGYVPQHTGGGEFKLPITVLEVVRLGAPKGDTAAALAALEAVDMAPYAGRDVRQLSGGQQQRVFIAKALAAEPAVLILDEPTAGVDVRAQAAFYHLLAGLNAARGLTIVLVSHDIDAVIHQVSRLACINETLVYYGKPQNFVQQDGTQHLHGTLSGKDKAARGAHMHGTAPTRSSNV